jgi:RNA polymerase sigma-70 factor (ECF subfamily)
VVELDEFTEHEVRSLANVLHTIEETERKELIKKSLNLLAAEENFLLTLYYFNEASLKEISAIMGINENNVKIKLFRSRKKLATILKNKLEPEIINQYEKQGR